MAKRPTQDISALGERERILMFCTRQRQRAGVTGGIVTALVW